MRVVLLIIGLLVTAFSFSQEEDEIVSKKKSDTYVNKGNKLIKDNDFVEAEAAYRIAVSEQPKNVAGNYNLGNAYYKKGNLDEALFRHEEAAKSAVSKSEKHKAYHNIGNILMKNKKCSEAVEAYKNALRNNPLDNETRYNLALAQQCAKQQEGKDKDGDKEDKKKENKQKKDDNKDKGGDNKEKDKSKDDKKEGKDNKDGKPKEDKQSQAPKQPKQGQMSPQQIKNLLEAMDNQEQKVQEKINAQKQMGVKIKTEKDW